MQRYRIDSKYIIYIKKINNNEREYDKKKDDTK